MYVCVCVVCVWSVVCVVCVRGQSCISKLDVIKWINQSVIDFMIERQAVDEQDEVEQGQGNTTTTDEDLDETLPYDNEDELHGGSSSG